ncbi:hypothetical protein K504DRAFT_393781, partial [Pleomassaria siparia CBS 279.74]
IQLVPRLTNPNQRNRMLKLVVEATKKPDLAHFTSARLTNTTHANPCDPKPHATMFLATDEQARNNRSQTVHIYHDAEYNYTGHTL